MQYTSQDTSKKAIEQILPPGLYRFDLFRSLSRVTGLERRNLGLCIRSWLLGLFLSRRGRTRRVLVEPHMPNPKLLGSSHCGTSSGPRGSTRPPGSGRGTADMIMSRHSWNMTMGEAMQLSFFLFFWAGKPGSSGRT